MTLLAINANYLRRSRWALETLVLEDAGGRRVRKRVPAGVPAAGRVAELAARHHALAAADVPVALPRILATGEGWIDVEWIEGETELAVVERLLHDRQYGAAHAEMERVLELLDRFPQTETDPYEHGDFAAFFDPGRTWRTGEREHCLVPGLYDFGLGNVIRPSRGGLPVLVDWEWTFDFPVPVAFVRFVIVRNSADYLQPLLRALASPRLAARIFLDDALVPEPWARAAALDPATIARFVAWEAAFQDRVHLVHRPFTEHVIASEPERVASRRDENAGMLVARLMTALDIERARADELQRAVADRDGQLAWAARQLSDLSGVRHSAAHLARLVVARRARRGGG